VFWAISLAPLQVPALWQGIEKHGLCDLRYFFSTSPNNRIMSNRLGQSKAYDAFYLALAERLKAEFWTADQRLANGARQLGANWAHWIGEEIGDIS
jgi:hypothetical protein